MKDTIKTICKIFCLNFICYICIVAAFYIPVALVSSGNEPTTIDNYTDPETGIEYIITNKGGITPRYKTSDGTLYTINDNIEGSE